METVPANRDLLDPLRETEKALRKETRDG
jgi:hypothetical protein